MAHRSIHSNLEGLNFDLETGLDTGPDIALHFLLTRLRDLWWMNDKNFTATIHLGYSLHIHNLAQTVGSLLSQRNQD